MTATTQNSTPDQDARAATHTASLQHHLNRACKAHRAETGGDLWGFTIDAVVYLVEWMALKQPELTRDFLHAVAARARAQTRMELDEADAWIMTTQAALYEALREQSGTQQ